jgi:hypothetical protein
MVQKVVPQFAIHNPHFLHVQHFSTAQPAASSSGSDADAFS